MSYLVSLGVLLCFGFGAGQTTNAARSLVNEPMPVLPAQVPQLSQQPKLQIKRDGNDIVITTMIWANNSPHVLQTSWQRATKQLMTIELRYVLIQNKDLLVRSRKKIRVTWRLKNMANVPGVFAYQVKSQQILLSMQDIVSLTPRLRFGSNLPQIDGVNVRR